MEVLLAYNDKAALIGDNNGKVRPEHRPPDQSPQGWRNFLQSEYREPLRVVKAKAFLAGEGAQTSVPFATYSDAEYGLSVTAAFDREKQAWFVADR